MNDVPKANMNEAAYRLITNVVSLAVYGGVDGKAPEVKQLADFLQSPLCKLTQIN